MNFPHPLDSGMSMLLYLFLLYIIAMGAWQFIRVRIRRDATAKPRSLVPLGAAALVVGLMGLFQSHQNAFDAIESAGDISPSIVAGAMRGGYSYPILGLFCLAVSFLFRYTNRREE